MHVSTIRETMIYYFRLKLKLFITYSWEFMMLCEKKEIL